MLQDHAYFKGAETCNPIFAHEGAMGIFGEHMGNPVLIIKVHLKILKIAHKNSYKEKYSHFLKQCFNMRAQASPKMTLGLIS